MKPAAKEIVVLAFIMASPRSWSFCESSSELFTRPATAAVPSRATATSARPGLMIYVAVVDFQSLAMDKNR
jgi:hypothetical protein